jgi:hypothetical protein
LEENSSACDNGMALRVKKVGKKRENGVFWGKNAEGARRGALPRAPVFDYRSTVLAKLLGHVKCCLRSAGRRADRKSLHRNNAVDALGQIREIGFVAAA